MIEYKHRLEPVLVFKTKQELAKFKAAIDQYKEENEAYRSGRAVIEMVTNYHNRVKPIDTDLFSNPKRKAI